VTKLARWRGKSVTQITGPLQILWPKVRQLLLQLWRGGTRRPIRRGLAEKGRAWPQQVQGGADVAVDGGGADEAAATPVDETPPYTEDWYSSAPYPEPAEMTYESLGAHPLSLTDEVNEVKQLAKALLVKGGRLDEACSVQRIRLRLKSGVRPGKVLPDGTTLAASFSALYEHMELQIEVVPQPEEHMLGKTKRERAEEEAKVEEQKEGGGATSEEGGGTCCGGYCWRYSRRESTWIQLCLGSRHWC